MSSTGVTGLDSSVLLSYYQSQLNASPEAIAAANAVAQQTSTASTSSSATANDVLPWNEAQPTQTAEQAKVLSTTNFLDTSNVPLTAGATTDSKLEQDNQKLFSIYNAVNSLAQLAQMANSSTATSGQQAGLNTRFQAGLAQVQQYLSSTTFNNYALQAATPAASTTSTAQVGVGSFTYNTRQLVTNSQLTAPLTGVSASDSFTIGIKKGGTTSNVNIDMSQVQGPLTLTNIVSYINSQLAAGGFETRFQKVETGGTTTSDANATYSLQVTPGGAEQVSLSAASSPALYMAGNSGIATETNTVTNTATSAVDTTPADQSGRLTKLSNIGTNPTATFSVNQDASSGTTTAAATVVDSSGDVYTVGNATGNFGNQLNQGAQDSYLTKYDSAGNVVWQHLLGSTGSASNYGLALDPSGGVVVTGASTSDLTGTSVADGNNDSYVARYDTDGNQLWVQQVQTLTTNQANAVSVDASGNVYIGGSVSGGVIGSGQTAQGGGGDAYLAKFNANGKLLAENQFGSSGKDSVSATTTGSDGSLYVASVQNGDAVVSKYANGDITSAPVWSQDLGALSNGGAVSGLTVSGGQVYVSGTTSNTNLTAGGQAGIASASSGGTDAFVFNLTDNGSTVSANHVSYVGTAATDQGGAVTVGPDGTVYLTGTTTGTFAGQSRNVANVTNAFVAAMGSDGSVSWARQYGGADGQSTGAGIAIDPNGASVLDALGLPRGTIDLNQSVDLEDQTTLRAGNSFQIAIQGTAARTATITIDPGETLDSLATKINAQLGTIGKASVNYTANAEGLNITVNAGNSINLVAGPADSDALARLGISPGVLSAPATGAKATTSTTTTTSANGAKVTLPTYGLGLTATALGPLDISTSTGASLTRSTLLSVLSNIQNTYQTTNTPPASTTTLGNTTGTASAYTTSQLASYNVALGLMNADPSNAVANIQAILANANSASSASASSSGTDLSSLLSSLGG